ncbi:hypothetical protein MJO29_005430 [Puccinia striiformis f. sp. tritici]|nr:hypothetical protein Pst134EB_010622 [Puccinia striiformis f. sp. tritici]KAI7960362.1 hypothetical protein MJO29_005430 [Puccinia striiformis f. sp. tritici]
MFQLRQTVTAAEGVSLLELDGDASKVSTFYEKTHSEFSMLKKQITITLAPPPPRLLAHDVPADRDPNQAHKDILWDFTDNGQQIWKEPQDEPSKLSSNIKRLWIERGDFSQLTIESIQKQQHQAPIPDTEEKRDEDNDNNQPKKISETITVDELWEMRMQMAHQLLVMSGELSTGLDLLNTLLAPLAPEAVDTSSLPLPSGGIGPMTHSIDHLSTQPEPITLINSSVSLMRKRKATQNASELLKQAALELGKESKRSQSEWDTLLKLREAGWNMRPKGAKPGSDISLMGRGAERAAKEIGIAYATTEAAEALRASSFASLEPINLEDPHQLTKISLKLPPRPRRRLTIKLRLPDQSVESFSPWNHLSHQGTDDLSFEEDLDRARAEILEEEIFGEISKEAQSSTTYRTSTSDRSVIVNGFWEDAEIYFEMRENEDEIQTTTEVSSKCKLISSMIRLLMISIYRSRRSTAIGIIPPNNNNTIQQQVNNQPKILEPVLDLIVFFIYTSNLHRLFLDAVEDLRPTKLDIKADLDPVIQTASQIVYLICNGGIDNRSRNLKSSNYNQKSEVCGVATLRIMGRRSITFTMDCPVIISYWLKEEPIRIGADQLHSVFINAINLSILDLLAQVISRDSNDLIDVKLGTTGLVCHSVHQKSFLTPKFEFGAGLSIKVEKLIKTKSRESSELLNHHHSSSIHSLADYRGQVGLLDWVHDFIQSMLL